MLHERQHQNDERQAGGVVSAKRMENDGYWAQVGYYRALPNEVQNRDPRIQLMVQAAAKGRDTEAWNSLLDALQGVDFVLLDRMENYRAREKGKNPPEKVLDNFLHPLIGELGPDLDRLERAWDHSDEVTKDPNSQDQFRRQFRRLATFLSEAQKLVSPQTPGWEAEWRRLAHLHDRLARLPALKKVLEKHPLAPPDRNPDKAEKTLADIEKWLKSSAGSEARTMACGGISGQAPKIAEAEGRPIDPEIDAKIGEIAKDPIRFHWSGWTLLEKVFDRWPKEKIREELIEKNRLGLYEDDLAWIKVAYEARFGDRLPASDLVALQTGLERHTKAEATALEKQAATMARKKIASALAFLSEDERSSLLDKFFSVRVLGVSGRESWSKWVGFFDHLPKGPRGDMFLHTVMPSVPVYDRSHAAWIRMFRDFREHGDIRLVDTPDLGDSIHYAIYDQENRGIPERERFLAAVSTHYNEAHSTRDTNRDAEELLTRFVQRGIPRVPIPESWEIQLPRLLGNSWQSQLGARRSHASLPGQFLGAFDKKKPGNYWVESSALAHLLEREDLRRSLAPGMANFLKGVPNAESYFLFFMDWDKITGEKLSEDKQEAIAKNLNNLITLDPDFGPSDRQKKYWTSARRVLKEIPEKLSRQERGGLIAKLSYDSPQAVSDLSLLDDILHFSGVRRSSASQDLDIESLIHRMQQAAPHLAEADAWLQANLGHSAVRAVSRAFRVGPDQARAAFKFDESGNMHLDPGKLAALAAPYSPTVLANIAGMRFEPPQQAPQEFRQMQRAALASMTPGFKPLRQEDDAAEFADFASEFPSVMQRIATSPSYTAQRREMLLKFKALPRNNDGWSSLLRFWPSKPSGKLISDPSREKAERELRDIPPPLLSRYLSGAVDASDSDTAMRLVTPKTLKQGARKYLFLRPLNNPNGPVTILAWDSDSEGFSALEMVNGSSKSSRGLNLSGLEPFVPELSGVDLTKLSALKPTWTNRGRNSRMVLSPVPFGSTSPR